MSQLTLRFSVVERNDRGQEVELVRKALQFKPQVSQESATESVIVLIFTDKEDWRDIDNKHQTSSCSINYTFCSNNSIFTSIFHSSATF